jgi:hypothetical protein
LERKCPLLPKAELPKNAVNVAIGGKADFGWRTAHVCF